MLFLLPLWVAVAFLASNFIVAALLLVLDWIGFSLEDVIRPAAYQTGVASVIYMLTVVVVLWVPYLLKKRRTSLEILGIQRLPSWSDIGLAPVGFVLYMIIIAIVLQIIDAWFPGLPMDQAQDVGFKAFGSRADNMLAFFTLVILAPVAEEVLFRGYLYGKLKGYVPVVWAAIVTSLLFGLVHFQLNVGIDVFILSLMLCGLRSLTGSIWAGVLVHMLKNAIAYYILFIGPMLGA